MKGQGRVDTDRCAVDGTFYGEEKAGVVVIRIGDVVS
jgi:hypothetical protein